MMRFETVAASFESKGCKLLTTKDEYVAMDCHKHRTMPKVKFIAKCGHDNEVFINVFIYRNTGVICKECSYKQVSAKNKETYTDMHEQEYKGFQVLEGIVGGVFEMKKTHEGCLADYVIRPKGYAQDEWLALQLKVSDKVSYNMCSFNIVNKYTNCIIVCIHLSLKKFWIMDGNIDLPKRLHITQKYSKYDKHQIAESALRETLQGLYDSYHKHCLRDMNVPVSRNCKLEADFRTLREDNVPIAFEYPKIENRVYDFTFEGKKIQEKVGSRSKKGRKGISFTLHKHNGRKKVQSYVKGDNDFYWLNCPDKKTFYILPEHVLIEKGLVSLTPGAKQKNIYICPGVSDRKNSWTEPYKFLYDGLEVSKVVELLRSNAEE